MFILFAILRDDAGAVTNESLIADVRSSFAWATDFTISTEELFLPRTTVVDLTAADGWRVRLSIRPGEEMTLSVPELQRILAPKATLPDDFLAYNVEIAIGFGDDPEREHTDDIINLGEFIRENYPGVLIFNQYDVDVW